MDCKPWFSCVFFVTYPIAIALDVTVQQFKESPGLYYNCVGEARLYSTEGKVVTYVILETVNENLRSEKLCTDVR
jgi:hypothetical protein